MIGIPYMYCRVSLYMLICCFLCGIVDVSASETVIMKALKSEMKRTMEGLKSQTNPPYFLSYAVTETKTVRMTASFGKLKSEESINSRVLDIDIRVGDNSLDNTHTIRGSRFEFGGGGRGVELPFSENEQALSSIIWAATDKLYKKAVERYGKVLTNKAVKVKEEDSSADFSVQKPEVFIEEAAVFALDTNAWREKVTSLSSLFLADLKFIQEMYIFKQISLQSILLIAKELNCNKVSLM